MPSPTRQLELADARSLIGSCGFGPSGAPRTPGTRTTGAPRTTGSHRTAGSHRTVGVELESFTVPCVDPERLPAVALPADSRLTFEPGGQVELSSPPQMTVAAACDTLSTDLAALRAALSPLGIELRQSGMAPTRPPRLIHGPRYQAMEAYFDTRWSEAGRNMMCATASVQVNLGLGHGLRGARRWRAANALGPVLAATFASSATGSGRLATWLALDPSRTAPVPCHPGDDPQAAWAEYALDAPVMLIRTATTHRAIVEGPMTARAWIEHGHPEGWPTADDVAYHLTTLFPPVRPRGWLELRMIDALPDPWWRVPVAVAAALLDDGEAIAAGQTVADRWWEAATEGMADGPIAAAAVVCATRSLAGLRRVGTDIATAALVEQWATTVRKGCEPPWA